MTCIYKHNINIHIMVINSIICRANLAYNVTLYTSIAKEKGIQCAEEANITDINRSFSLTTPYTKNSIASWLGGHCISEKTIMGVCELLVL